MGNSLILMQLKVCVISWLHFEYVLNCEKKSDELMKSCLQAVDSSLCVCFVCGAEYDNLPTVPLSEVGAFLRPSGWWPTGVLGRRLLNCNAASLAGSSSPRCWNCGGPGGPPRGDRFFCPRCRALQPPDPTRDYFSLMDCNRSFRVDTVKLQHRYQQLQRLVHPDFFSQRSQNEKDFSEKHSTLVNEAYKTLLAPLSRGLYLLKLRGIEIPEGTDYEMDSQFLTEIMEINEKLAEAQGEIAMKEIESIVRAKQKELTDDVSRAFERDNFEKAKELLTKMRYFSNIEEKIKLKKIPL